MYTCLESVGVGGGSHVIFRDWLVSPQRSAYGITAEGELTVVIKCLSYVEYFLILCLKLLLPDSCVVIRVYPFVF
jgi:hypothetical protein